MSSPPLDDAIERSNAVAQVDSYNDAAKAEYGRSPDRIAHFAELAYGLALTLDYTAGLAFALKHSASADLYRGNLGQAENKLLQAVELFKKSDNLRQIAGCYNNLGIAADQQGAYSQALRYYLLALPILETLNEPVGLFRCHNNLGIIYGNLRSYTDALDHFLTATTFAQQVNDVNMQVRVAQNIGNVYVRLEEIEKAEQQYTHVLGMASQLQPAHDIIQTHFGMARVRLMQGQFVRALDHVANGQQLAEETGQRRLQDEGDLLRCKIWVAQGEFAQAQPNLERLVERYAALDNQPSEFRTLEALVEIYAAQGKHAAAFTAQTRMLEIQRTIFDLDLSRQVSAMAAKFEVEKERQSAALHQLKNVELAQRNDALEALHEERRELFQLIAHNLRNPLTTIQLLTGLLSTDIKQPASVQRARVAQIDANLERLANSVDRILSIEELTTTTKPVVDTPVDLRALVTRCIAQFEPQATAKEIALVQQTGHEAAWLAVDSQLVADAIDNLLANAIKFSPAGSTITATVSDPHTHADGHTFIRCSISDNGPGLSDADKDRMFRKFTPLSASPTGNESSTGLGLYLVKRICQTLGGSIAVDSAGLGHGATFTLELPYATRETTPPTA